MQVAKFIPRTPQTDRDNFPEYEFKKYPMMVLDDNRSPIVATQEIVRAGFADAVGEFVILDSAESEREWNEFYSKSKPATGADALMGSPRGTQAELDRLRAENAALRKAAERGKPGPKPGSKRKAAPVNTIDDDDDE